MCFNGFSLCIEFFQAAKLDQVQAASRAAAATEEAVRCALGIRVPSHEDRASGGFFYRGRRQRLVERDARGRGNERECCVAQGGKGDDRWNGGSINKFAVPISGNHSACLISFLSPV